MIVLAYNDVVNGVIRLMDEHGGNAQFMSGSAMDETKRVIEQVSEDAVRKVHLQAPTAMLDAIPAQVSSSMQERNGRWMCQVALPDDFLRLVRCRMSSWVKPVSQLWWEDSAEYAKQGNKFLMGTWQRPMAFLVHQGALQWVEMYSSEDMQDTVREFLYVKRPEWFEGKMFVSDRLKDSSLMQVAADALTVLGESERAQQMQQMAERTLMTYGGMERHNADNGNRIEK